MSHTHAQTHQSNNSEQSGREQYIRHSHWEQVNDPASIILLSPLVLLLWQQKPKVTFHKNSNCQILTKKKEKKEKSVDRSFRVKESSPLFLFFFFLQSHILTHTCEFVKSFGDARWAPGIIVIANPDIIELQSDRVTPGAARTITLRPGSQWKSCIGGKKKKTLSRSDAEKQGSVCR